MLHVVQECHLVVVAAEQKDLSSKFPEAIQRRTGPVREIPRMRCQQMTRLRAGGRESRHVMVDYGPWIRSKELDQHTMGTRGSRRERIEWRVLVENLSFLLRTQHASTDVIVVRGTPHIHHQRAALAKGIGQGEVNLVGTAGHFAHTPHRGVEHHGIAGTHPEGREVSRKVTSRPHLPEPP